MQLRRLFILLFIFILLILAPAQAQGNEPVVLKVTAAFGGFYRPEFWMPLQVQVRNEGVSLRGQISVRPETTGREVETAYSTPIELPTGSEKTVFLYIQVNAGADRILVEFITDDGVRVAEQPVGLSSIYQQDALHVVVSNSSANNINLNDVSAANFHAHQARWQIDNLPPAYQALMALNTITLYNLNSEDFTVGQRDAIEQWVTMGGHLIVIGGPNWNQTASSLNEWLPFLPTSTVNVDGLDALNRFVNNDNPLSGRATVTTGNLSDDAQVIIQTDSGLPLYVRREMGLGTVDYFTVDPTLAPLRNWQYQSDFWKDIVRNMKPQPGWIRGILDKNYAARSVAILPGVNLLPSVMSMIGFILAYIALIGPINYWILSRINRRALGWITIPLFIGIFTALSWTVGFNLRGSEVIVSRQFIVQSFTNKETARQNEIVGIFSPRRETYTINAPVDTFMRVLPTLTGDSFLDPAVQRSTVDIVQSDRFIAQNVVIDGGIFSNFAMMNTVKAPAISGSVNFAYDPRSQDGSGRLIRGFVRNDSDISLNDAVILTDNYFYRLSDPLKPGDLLDFDTSDFRLIHAESDNLLALSSPIESSYALDLGRQGINSLAGIQSIITSQVFLGTNAWTTNARFRNDISFKDENDSTTSRHRSLIFSFMRDQYAAGNIGNRAFLMGWSDDPQKHDIAIEGTNYRVLDTSLYIVQLDFSREAPPSNTPIQINNDQFTWSFLDRSDSSVGGMNDFYVINPGKADLRFTPQPGAVLDHVSKLTVNIDRSSSYGRDMDFYVWNWRLNDWEMPTTLLTQSTYEFDDPQDYLGPDNTVDIRLALDSNTPNLAASVRVRGVQVTEIGTFN